MDDPRPVVLLVTPWAPYPFDGGSKRIHSLCLRLKDRFRFRLLTFSTQRPRGDARAVANDLRQEAQFLRPVFDDIRWIEKPLEPPASDFPADIGRFWSASMREAVERAAADADIVHIEYDLMAPYGAGLRGVPTVLTQHDAGTLSFTQSYFREMAGWRKLLQVGAWLRRVRFERAAGARFDCVIALTEPDARRLGRIVDPAKIRVVTTGVDLEHFRFRGAEPAGGAETLVFVGHYPHFPNEDGLVQFCRRVLPIIRRARPRVRLLAIGSDPTPAVRRLAEADPNVTVTGTVDDVAPWLEKGGVFIAPIRLGQGIKGKILEAFAVGVPVVATPAAAAGLGASSGRELLVAGSPGAFARAALRLLDSARERSEIARAARAFVEERFEWGRSADLLASAYGELLPSCRAAETLV